jgi:16S rRNA (cytidine1402-2'-O)-methyltransferase
VTIVVEGAPEPVAASTPEELARLVSVREQSGEPRKEAIAGVARELGVAKRDVYDAVVTAKSVDPRH